MDEGDGNSTRGRYELAGAIRFAYTQRRWVVIGTSEDDDALTLRVIVQAPDSSELVQRRHVRIPIRVEGDRLIVGQPLVDPEF